MGNYSALKINYDTCYTIEDIMLSEIGHSQRDKYCDPTHMRTRRSQILRHRSRTFAGAGGKGRRLVLDGDRVSGDGWW